MALKIAVVGTGTVSRNNYIPYLASQPDVELGCYNRTHSTAIEVAEQFGARAFLSLEELVQWQPSTCSSWSPAMPGTGGGCPLRSESK